MQLENIVVDALEPQRLGRFWEAALGCERLTDEPDILETRLAVADGPWLDLCFQRVQAPPEEPLRLHLDLVCGQPEAEEVERLFGLGALPAGPDHDDVPWGVMADPEGNPFSLAQKPATYVATGPVAALALDSADPERDASFYAWLTGWTQAPVALGTTPYSLQHPSGRGLLLDLRPERVPKDEDAKNRRHLDVRLEPGEEPDGVAAEVVARGGREVSRPEWGDLPWRLFQDPSGNEFCVLPARE